MSSTGKELSSHHGRLYGFIQGNVTKKELDFENIVKVNFAEGFKIEELIDMVASSQLSLINAKDIAYLIVDGDTRAPLPIAQARGLLGTASNVDYDAVITEILAANQKTVDKIKESGKDGPVMFLVG